MRLSSRAPLLAALLALPIALPAQDTFPAVERIVAIGDVHGDYGQFLAALRQSGLVDEKGNWSGGRTHFVQTGDIPDRGPDTRKILDFLMELTKQAEKAGGRVHALIGNHEAMNVLGDLRYVHPGEYAAFAGPNSKRQQDRAWQVLSDSTKREDAAYRTQWLEEHPLGWLEHRLAWEGNGRYGTWVRGHNAIVKIGDYLFLHGGIGPKYVDSTITAMNTGVRAALSGAGTPPAEGNIAEDTEGPLWYRGLATEQEAVLDAHVDSVLRKFGVKHVVIGHSTTPGAILPRFAGRVILIDVGLGAAYGSNLANLVIENGKPFAVHRGRKLELPIGGDVLPYLKGVAALEPDSSRLKQYVERLTTAGVP
jgi:hypothetical protein